MTNWVKELYVTTYDPGRVDYLNAQLVQENETLREHVRYLESLLDAKDLVIAEYQEANGQPLICYSRTEGQARLLRDKLMGKNPPKTWAGVIAMSTPEVIHFFTYEVQEAFRFNPKAKNPKRDAKIIMRFVEDNFLDFKTELLGHGKKVLYIIFKPD